MKRVGYYSKSRDFLCKSYRALGYPKGDFVPVYIKVAK
jgi:hypothetical protein